MDLGNGDDGAGSRKVGLARKAKNNSLSNSMNSLNAIDTRKLEERDDHSIKLREQMPNDHPVSPARSLGKQSGSVNLLPDKMDISSLSGQQLIDKRKNSNVDENSHISECKGQSVPCSDPEFVKSAKVPVKQTESLNINQVSPESSKGHSPRLSLRSRLSPPQIKRSSSMTRLTEAFNQVHNLCIFAAQPLGIKDKEAVSEECQSQSSKQLTTTPPTSESSSHDSGRTVSWYGNQSMSVDYQTNISSGSSDYKSYAFNSEDSLLQNCRSASLDELSNMSIFPGLPSLSPSEVKKKNYLFGGHGNGSLLGSKELDRYFPNRTVTVFIATWNMNGKEPPMNLDEFLLPETMDHVPDMFVIGTQESGGSRSEWEVRLQATIGPSHVLFTSAVFGVLHLIVFLRRDLVWFCSVPEVDTYSLRPGIAYKTKGGMAIGFQFFGTRFLFINSHLTAHEEKQHLRIQNIKNISQALELPRLLHLRHKHKDVTQRYDCTFWLGDLNFRLAVNRDHVFERLQKPSPEVYQHLLQWDQLSQARNKGEAFHDFEEGPITFAPTFKFDPGTDHYDSSSKQRVPSYTDRILFRCNREAVKCTSYHSCPLFKTSDHKPVSGVFQVKVRPGKDDCPLAAGLFNRDVYLEALKRRKRFLYQPALRNCPVQ